MPETPTNIDEILSTKNLTEQLHHLAKLVCDQTVRPALWVGAGMSAKYGGLPTWRAYLSDFTRRLLAHRPNDVELCNLLIASGRTSLAAEILATATGDRFFDELVEAFGSPTGKLPTFLGRWGIRDIITTNYDLLLEHCFPEYSVVLPSSGMPSLLSMERKIVKIHGTISFPKSCVASISSYVKNYDNNLEWYIAQVFSSRPIIFIGSSMSPSEPFFSIMRLLKQNPIARRDHIAIVAVNSSAEGSRLGKYLGKFGIRLLPYIPDCSHSCLDEIIVYIQDSRSNHKSVISLVQLVNSQLKERRLRDAGIALSDLINCTIVPKRDQRVVADTTFQFFRVVAEKTIFDDDIAILCESNGLVDVVLKTFDFIEEPDNLSTKSIKSLKATLLAIFGAENRWRLILPNETKGRFNRLVDQWAVTSNRHPSDAISKFEI